MAAVLFPSVSFWYPCTLYHFLPQHIVGFLVLIVVDLHLLILQMNSNFLGSCRFNLTEIMSDLKPDKCLKREI